jgi:hypothetical protein
MSAASAANPCFCAAGSTISNRFGFSIGIRVRYGQKLTASNALCDRARLQSSSGTTDAADRDQDGHAGGGA